MSSIAKRANCASKPTTTSIFLRLTDSFLGGFRQEANKLDVPHRSLMKVWLTEKLREANG